MPTIKPKITPFLSFDDEAEEAPDMATFEPRERSAFWAATGVLVLGLVLLGFATAYIGLAVVLPLIGHATWHAYRETVETEHARSA